MAKEREQKIARIMYVEQGKQAKEISQMTGVSEVTLSKWVNKFGWKDQRNARISSPGVRLENIRQLINDLSEQRIELGQQVKEAERVKDSDAISDLRKQIACVDDAVSKWNKTLENLNNENRVSLSVYLNVMEQIFEALKVHDEKLFFNTLDFQEIHINDISVKFK
jgi:transposase